MKTVIKIIFISIVSIAFMEFTSWGNYDPSNFGFYWSIISSIILTISIDWITPKMMRRIAKNLDQNLEINLNKDERLDLSTEANHFKGLEAVGGKLVLTDKRLIFKSHKYNVQNHEMEFEIPKISNISINKKNSLNFNYNNTIERFVINEPRKWKEYLEKLG